jgi:hypothetical protein
VPELSGDPNDHSTLFRRNIKICVMWSQWLIRIVLQARETTARGTLLCASYKNLKMFSCPIYKALGDILWPYKVVKMTQEVRFSILFLNKNVYRPGTPTLEKR